MKSIWLHFVLLLFFVWACQNKPAQKVTQKQPSILQKYPAGIENYAQQIHTRLASLHTPMQPPQAGDWLETHKEKGQSFAEYLQDTQFLLNKDRKWIVILPIGDFLPKQKDILTKTVHYLEHFYQLRSHILPALSEKELPKRAKRENGIDFQIYTPYILDEVLLPQMQDTIACMLAFTAHDLYPHPNWQFVFGQASLVNRTGVWSMNRFGNPEKDIESYQTCLLHTIKTAIHEAGHIFGIKHCTKYECCMAGSNNLSESARRTVVFCPVCTAKVGAHLNLNLAKQHQELATFWQKNNFTTEYNYYKEATKLLKNTTPPHSK